MSGQLDIVIIGLSITSSWGNGHATTYRGLVRELCARGHRVTFLERDAAWYASNRDLPYPPYGTTRIYADLDELRDRHSTTVRDADLVIVGSYVPEGVAVGEWVMGTSRGITAFYDIDTPVTLAKLARGDHEYVSPEQIPRYHLYLSFTGGPTLTRLEKEFGSPCARPLYCSVDPSLYFPDPCQVTWDLAYLGTYSTDRQPMLDRLLIEPARREPRRRFVVAGAQYPPVMRWGINVERREHVAPGEHRKFYNAQRFALNVTRVDMVRAGWSPSVRLFEAAACGIPIISDEWAGLETLLRPGEEILIARTADDVIGLLAMGENARRMIGKRARDRVLSEHTAAHRVHQLEGHVRALPAARRRARAAWTGAGR
jgi:spore maturation protein CgeB